MIKQLLLVFFIFLVKLNGSTVSLTISEELINNYLSTVGEYKYYSKRDNSEWIVQNPHVKIQNDEISDVGRRGGWKVTTTQSY